MASPSSDMAILQSIGTDVLRSFVSVVVETWFVAIYTILVVKAGSILLHKTRRRNKSSFVMWILVLLMYLMDITLWVMDVRNVVAELNTTLIDTYPDTLDERYTKSTDSVLKLSLAVDALYAFMTILGDAIVLWRVQAFWSHGRDRFFMLIPCTTWFVSVILTFLLSYCAARSDADVSFGQFEHPAFCRNIQSAAYWAQFVTAAVATGMIGVKTWMYRRMVKSFMTDLRNRSPANKAMLILVDTGLLYTLFFLAEVLLNIGVLDGAINKNPRLDFALEVYDFQTSTIVGLYPTIVVILVHTQCFMLDKEGNTTTLTTIDFSHRRHRSKRSGRGTGMGTGTVEVPEVSWRDLEGDLEGDGDSEGVGEKVVGLGKGEKVGKGGKGEKGLGKGESGSVEMFGGDVQLRSVHSGTESSGTVREVL